MASEEVLRGKDSETLPDEGSSKRNKTVDEMMKDLKLTAAESDRLEDDDEEEQVAPIWAIAGKILAPGAKLFHINTISSAFSQRGETLEA